jgi:hypothetical protein
MRPVRRADNFTTFMCRLYINLGASTSWNPQGLSRSVQGLLYLIYIYIYIHTHTHIHTYIHFISGSQIEIMSTGFNYTFN